jgi:hypothetical protein
VYTAPLNTYKRDLRTIDEKRGEKYQRNSPLSRVRKHFVGILKKNEENAHNADTNNKKAIDSKL